MLHRAPLVVSAPMLGLAAPGWSKMKPTHTGKWLPPHETRSSPLLAVPSTNWSLGRGKGIGRPSGTTRVVEHGCVQLVVSRTGEAYDVRATEAQIGNSE